MLLNTSPYVDQWDLDWRWIEWIKSWIRHQLRGNGRIYSRLCARIRDLNTLGKLSWIIMFLLCWQLLMETRRLLRIWWSRIWVQIFSRRCRIDRIRLCRIVSSDTSTRRRDLRYVWYGLDSLTPRRSIHMCRRIIRWQIWLYGWNVSKGRASWMAEIWWPVTLNYHHLTSMYGSMGLWTRNVKK